MMYIDQTRSLSQWASHPTASSRLKSVQIKHRSEERQPAETNRGLALHGDPDQTELQRTDLWSDQLILKQLGVLTGESQVHSEASVFVWTELLETVGPG